MLTDCLNDALVQCIFPNSSKFTNITPAHQKDKAKVIHDQLSQYLEK